MRNERALARPMAEIRVGLGLPGVPRVPQSGCPRTQTPDGLSNLSFNGKTAQLKILVTVGEAAQASSWGENDDC